VNHLTEITIDGTEIKQVECLSSDAVRIFKKDGTFILISPNLRDAHNPTEDLVIEEFPENPILLAAMETAKCQHV